MASSVASRKAKGRRLQQRIREDLRLLGKAYGLTVDDIESRQMGGSGVDIILSQAGKKIFPFDVEAKNQESLNTWSEFWKHYAKYDKTSQLKMLVQCKNRGEPVVMVRWKDFLRLYKRYLELR
jgi:hypothetical protein